MKPIKQWVKDAYAKRKAQLFGNYSVPDSVDNDNHNANNSEDTPDSAGANEDRDED